MSKRRERAKAQTAQLNQQLVTTKEAKDKKRSEQLVELGKFFNDLAKLVFGGVILTTLREQEYNLYKIPLIGTALVALVMFVILGYQLIRYGNKKG